MVGGVQDVVCCFGGLARESTRRFNSKNHLNVVFLAEKLGGDDKMI
jgi:hypothetical protein